MARCLPQAHLCRRRHRRTLAAIFATPTSFAIRFSDVESLLVALGAEIKERAGSRVFVALNDVRAVFHRPHPSPVMDKGAVRSMRTFLENAGVRP